MNQQFASTILTFPLFAGFTEYGAQMVLEPGELKEYAPADLVFAEGDSPAFTLLVLTGKLEVFLKRPNGDLSLNELGPGAIVGELGVLCGLARTASLRAKEKSSVVQWDAPVFRRLLLRNALLSERILGQSLRTLINKERLLVDALAPLQGESKHEPRA